MRYRNTRESLGELEIAWKHSPLRARVPFRAGIRVDQLGKKYNNVNDILVK